ncbi:MAG: thiamine-phosphate pyrophosphorylase [Campylobacterales bacterium]|nr:thiamine-phosphate pyrophosphorylase [Campylobacterales bacterium]
MEGFSPASLRILDANLNRLREGLRVLEDIRRYGFDDQALAAKLKDLRHQARLPNVLDLLKARDIQNDVLKATTHSESSRTSLDAITLANIKRAQESTRVLEEILKLENPVEAERFKQIRYALYDIEKALF